MRISIGILSFLLVSLPAIASAQFLLPNAEQTFVDANGVPLSGGKVFTYVPGSTTPKTTWVDSNLTVANANPITLDAAGRAIIWGVGAYREIVQDSLGVQQWDLLTSVGGLTSLPLSVADLAALQQLSVTVAPGGLQVVRQTFSSTIFSPPLAYKASGSSCSLNGGAGDNGSQVKAPDGCWLAIINDDYNPQYWGADRTASVDSTAALLATALWIGNNVPGGRLDCGGYGNHYLIGNSAQANTPLFALTHAVDWYGCYLIAAAMTSTTDIWSISPTTADTDGWGFEYVTVFSNLDTAFWRNTWRFDDGGNNQKFIRQLKFHDILIYPSQNRAGSDFDVEATDLGTGLLVQSSLGPNVGFFEGFTCTHCGDSITLNGFTISTDGVVAANKTCLAVSLATSGAGEFTANDLNCQTYGGAVLTAMYGTHLRGGVFECQGNHIASPTGAFLSIIGSTNLDVDKVQFQGGACLTPPKAINIDGSSRTIEARPIIGGNMAAGPYVVAAAAFPTTYIETYGHQFNRPYFMANRNVDAPGFAAGANATIVFDTVTADPTLSYNNGTGHFTPKVDGQYEVTGTACVNAAFNVGSAYELLLTVNDSTVISGPVRTEEVAGTYSDCQTVSGQTFLNGSTDFVDVRINVSTVSAGSVTVKGNQASTFSVKRLSP